MIFAVFSLMIWLSVMLTQVLVIVPLKALHLFNLPPILGLAILFGIFAWIFGDTS
ncbi:MAG: hypothetical protein ACFCU8_01515 [Thermosynechococcaceae cyanobacterium]